MASTMPRPAPPGYPYALSICARDEADACKSGSSYKAGDGSTVCLVREWLAAGPWRWLTGELPHGTSGLEYPRSNRELAESYQRSFQIRSHRRRSVRFSESFQRGKLTGVSGHTSSILRSSANLKPYSPFGELKHPPPRKRSSLEAPPSGHRHLISPSAFFRRSRASGGRFSPPRSHPFSANLEPHSRKSFSCSPYRLHQAQIRK